MADENYTSGSGSSIPPSEGVDQSASVDTDDVTGGRLAATVLAELELVHARTERTDEEQRSYDGWICRRKWSHWYSDAPDYSMVPHVWPGQAVKFEPNLAPREGDGVLILLPNGEAYFREFGLDIDDNGEFTGILEARPTGGDRYKSFFSHTDQFIVLGVLTAVRGRWSQE